LQLYCDLGDQLGEAHTLNHLGSMQHLVADYPAAVASQMQALKLYTDLGYLIGEANATSELGLVQYLTGDYRAAAASVARGLELARSIGYRTGEADALITLGAVHLAVEDLAGATATLSSALASSKDLGYRYGEAAALYYLAIAQYAKGDCAASQYLTRALELYRGLGDHLGEARVLNAIGETSPATDAEAFHVQALEVATEMGAPTEQARAREGIGRCQFLRGQPEQAAESLSGALAIYRRIGSPRAAQVEESLRNRGQA
jgi:tetratricopeptide (TPR) repeat protein